MNILLTGGAGYIGSHVALSLLSSGHNVHIIDNLSTGYEILLPKNANFTCCGIEDSERIAGILNKNKFDALMHFAGYIQVEESVNFPEKYFINNTDNSIKLFETCKKNGLNKIIFSSTAASYGSSDNKMVDEKEELKPENPYAISKIKTENYLLENEKYFKFIILRYFNVAGADPDLRTGQISKNSTHLIKILSEVITGKRNKLEIFGKNYNTNDGTAIRDYIHISDLAKIHIDLTEYLLKNLKSDIFNCGYGRGYSVLEVVKAAINIYPNKINYTFNDKRKGDVEYLVSDISRLKKHINWKPKYDNLNTIIKTAVNWEKKLNEENI